MKRVGLCGNTLSTAQRVEKWCGGRIITGSVILMLMTFHGCARQYYYSGSHINTIGSITYNRGVISVSLSSKGRVFWSEGRLGNRHYVDLHSCQVKFKGARQVGDQFIEEYHWAQNNPRTVRVVFTLREQRKVTVRRTGDRIVIVIAGARPWREGKRNFILLIDPGHGGDDPGSVGAQGTKEKDVNLDVALKLAGLFAREPYMKVYLTRDSDRTLSLEARRQMTRELRPDLLISIHLNSHSDKNKNQSEVYYYHKDSADLADEVADALIKNLRLNRKVVKRKGLHVLKDNNAQFGILVEPIYLSHTLTESKLKNNWYRHQISQILHAALITFIRNN